MSAIKVTGAAVYNGPGNLRDDAELGDVLLELFRTNYDDHGIAFLDAVLNSVTDDLSMLELAYDSDNSVDEAPRVIQRLRQRLIVARWLNERIVVEKAAGYQPPDAEPRIVHEYPDGSEASQ